ncbi:HAD family hydrolase [Capnocytophaga sp. oral taxon 878]|uniref:HAD family hydrolase n=1 Tax=Capnocytophaga sp. oral taxon 878 TaxID=1316596 RepID=UPI000D040CF2|nr:HAD family hydrolase [Capnocytophaga sp. oral taxon 878]AVM50156.1 Cof-type HAD-IIB family hydrolase [Capnocytophaga sp. oral taxon 878]
MIKLIVSDIDGTMVNNQKEVPNSFWNVFEMMHSKSILFCAASGRQVQSLQQLFAPIKDLIAYAPDNGASLIYEGKTLFECPISFASFLPILRTCEQIEHIGVALCGKNSAYIKTDNNWIFEEIARHYPAHTKVENFSAIDDDIFKITICDKGISRLNSYKYLQQYNREFNVVVSGEIWLDITRKDVNKGNAINHLQKQLSITPDETVVFGDHLNDVELIQCATHSYAMKNAQEELKKLANNITEYDNNNAGVVREIEKILQNL